MVKSLKPRAQADLSRKPGPRHILCLVQKANFSKQTILRKLVLIIPSTLLLRSTASPQFLKSKNPIHPFGFSHP